MWQKMIGSFKKTLIFDTNGSAGAAGIKIMGLIIIAVLLFSVATVIANAYSTIQNVQAMVQKAVTDTAADNAYNVYKGVREENTANVKYEIHAGWYKIDLTKDVIAQLKTLLQLQNLSDVEYAQYDNSGLLRYSISDVNVSVTEINKNANNDVCLSIKTKFYFHMPLRVGSAEPIVTLKLPITVKSVYIPLY